MSNSWFQFKQFTVHQDQCAMKVSTDACIQGAWTPVRSTIGKVLDIGAGSGLLSLMIAQRISGCFVDAVEWDEKAAIQAAENTLASPFADRIKVHCADATIWTAPTMYDLIICNPPFFKNSLLGPDIARNAARHAGVLNFRSLIDTLLKNLDEDATASVMWPQEEHQQFFTLAESHRLFLQTSLELQDKEHSRVTRMIGIYSRQPADRVIHEKLIIKAGDGSYCPDFIQIMSPFYLSL